MFDVTLNPLDNFVAVFSLTMLKHLVEEALWHLNEHLKFTSHTTYEAAKNPEIVARFASRVSNLEADFLSPLPNEVASLVDLHTTLDNGVGDFLLKVRRNISQQHRSRKAELFFFGQFWGHHQQDVWMELENLEVLVHPRS